MPKKRKTLIRQPRPNTLTIPGHLEIDIKRGVIYFHSEEKTRLRICRLPKPIPFDGSLLDITHMHGCSWGHNNDEEPE